MYLLNKALGNEMLKDGYTQITNIDYSAKCIEILKNRFTEVPNTFKCNIYINRHTYGREKNGL